MRVEVENLINRINKLSLDSRLRVVVVYNRRSSKYKKVEQEVIDPLRKLPGIMLGKYEVQPTNVDENAKLIARILKDEDVIISAGGDGTASIALNGAIRSKKRVKFFAVGYGNFNDTANSVKNLKSGTKIYPLEIKVNNEIYRYAISYFTMGMFAESTKIFDEKKTRKHLRKGQGSLIYSMLQLFRWYLRNRKKEFIPQCILNGKKMKITDYIALNGKHMARLMKGGRWYLMKRSFSSSGVNLRSFWSLIVFMTRSVFRVVPGVRTREDVIEFEKYAEVELQIEGEYKRFTDVEKIEVKKIEKSLLEVL